MNHTFVGVVAGAAALVPVGLASAPAVDAGAADAWTSRPDATHPDCVTRLLSPAEMAAGTRSIVQCYARDAAAGEVSTGAHRAVRPSRDGLVGRGHASGLVARHVDSAGYSLSIAGTTCDGGGISFNAGDYWNDRIVATRHQSCSTIKHWADANYSGAEQTTQGASGAQVSLNGSLSGQVSSIRYYGPVN